MRAINHTRELSSRSKRAALAIEQEKNKVKAERKERYRLEKLAKEQQKKQMMEQNGIEDDGKSKTSTINQEDDKEGTTSTPPPPAVATNENGNDGNLPDELFFLGFNEEMDNDSLFEL